MLLLFVLDYLPTASYGYTLPDTRRITYSRDFLLQLQSHFHQGTDKLPEELQRKLPTDKTDTLHNNRKKVTRRGRKKKGGIKAKLRRGGNKHRALPSVILANVRSLRNKTDELQANVYHMYEYRTASILAFTETWLTGSDNSDSMYIDGFGSPVRLDRDTELTGKHHGGGVCLHINPRWCKTVVVREELCNPDIELLAVSLRPFYLPR